MSRSNPLIFTRGSCIEFDIPYKLTDGSVDPVGSETFAIYASSSPAIFGQAVLEKTDPGNGIVRFSLEAAVAAGLAYGNIHWVRISRTFLDDCVETSPPIWICIE